jgi:hypothetical protein
MSKQLNENLISLRIQFRNSIETSHCLHVILINNIPKSIPVGEGQLSIDRR